MSQDEQARMLADLELIAIAAMRHGHSNRFTEIDELIGEVHAKFGDQGVIVLIEAQARFSGLLASFLAEMEGRTFDEYVDDFEHLHLNINTDP